VFYENDIRLETLISQALRTVKVHSLDMTEVTQGNFHALFFSRLVLCVVPQGVVLTNRPQHAHKAELTLMNDCANARAACFSARARQKTR
jgi:hypothetical protein